MNRTKTTEAFEKYIDPIFIIQNGLMFVAPKKFCERFDQYDYSLENYNDELWLRAGMCVELAEKIQKHLSFNNTVKLYTDKMLKIASNQDLDFLEVEEKTKDLDNVLFSHAKLQYCFDNYLNKITLNNNISILAILMAMYEKVIKMKKEKNPTAKVEGVTNSKWYRYVRDAMIEEENVNIKNYSKFSFQEISERLFDLIVECEYYLANSTEETMLSVNKENIVLDIFVIEEDNDYQGFKQEFEQKVYFWMVDRIHEREKNI